MNRALDKKLEPLADYLLFALLLACYVLAPLGAPLVVLWLGYSVGAAC